MIEMDYAEWASWSDETGDPQVFRPRPSEWELVGFLANNGYWEKLKGVIGERPRLLEGLIISEPTEFELSYYKGAAEMTLYERDGDVSAYEYKSPSGSQINDTLTREDGDLIEWDEAA